VSYNPDISCVIPTHGRPDYLVEAITSVLGQTVPVREIVVVSDDRNGESKSAVEAIARESGIPIRFVENYEGGGGASSSRNAGARVAGGSLLAFLDDDDLWEPQYVERSIAALARSQAPCVVSWLMMFRDDVRVSGSIMKSGLVASDVASSNTGFIGSNFIVTAASFWAVGGFDPELRVINDGDFIFRYLTAEHTYVVNENFDVLQRKHGSGQLTAPSEMRAQGLEKYMAKHRESLKLSDRRYLRLAINRMRYHTTTSRVGKVRYLLAGAFNSSPTSVATSITGWNKRGVWHRSSSQ
jgi:glycosyltransferase involved in cell wall biosynthesis